ncbi:MAG: hypothetical protein ACTINL_22565, partial [Serratia proteamaculans]
MEITSVRGPFPSLYSCDSNRCIPLFEPALLHLVQRRVSYFSNTINAIITTTGKADSMRLDKFLSQQLGVSRALVAR